MCGIVGIYNAENSEHLNSVILASMADTLVHRGPDSYSAYIDDCLGLGFRRLSIIDIENGNQPFFSEDKSVVLICNGEIYNYKELKSNLESKGYIFRSNSDIEVIVHLYTEYGIKLLDKLNGQFAFALFDKKNQSLFLARDPFGICPLFYTYVNNTFLFASEIKAIIKHPLIKRKVNLEGLDQILTFPGLVSPISLFKNISSLAPGHYLIFKENEFKLFEYWDLIYPEYFPDQPQKPESFYIEKLEDLLLKSIKCRLNADVPIGFYLSGGMDSSLIAAMVNHLNPGNTYHSFSVCFPSENQMDEQIYQDIMISHLQLKNTKVIFDTDEIEKRLTQAVYSSECALKESYNTCSLALSESVRKNGIKVILSGEGADELFGGYIGYRFDKQRSNGTAGKDMEQQLEDDFRLKLWGDPNFFYEKSYYEFSDIKYNLYSKNVREAYSDFNAVENLCFKKERIHNRNGFNKRSYVDVKLRLCDHLISDHCDRATYSNSVEGRFPFLDINLVEFVKTLPPDLKLKGLVEKYILRKVSEKYIPESIYNRQKFGFVAPGSPHILKKNKEWINDLLSYDQIKRLGYFDPDSIEHLKKNYMKDDFRLNLPYDSDMLIVALTFNIFIEKFGMPPFA